MIPTHITTLVQALEAVNQVFAHYDISSMAGVRREMGLCRPGDAYWDGWNSYEYATRALDARDNCKRLAGMLLDLIDEAKNAAEAAASEGEDAS